MSRRPPRQFLAIHAEDDKVRPRFVRALEGSFARLGARIDTDALEVAIARRDLGAAREALAAFDVEDALTPAAQILQDAVIKGGKLVNR